MKTIVIIPARYDSTRFPGKPLALINGKTMIAHMVDNLTCDNYYLVVVTDNQKIEDEVKSIGGNVVRVNENVSTGTDRVYIAYDRYFKHQDFDLIINAQGDEPLLKKENLLDLIEFHKRNTFDVSTLIRQRVNDDEDFNDPSTVKVAIEDAVCYYFSRSPIPYNSTLWCQHIGIYLYEKKFLKKAVSSHQSCMEQIESLEQLRFLSLGAKIGAWSIENKLIGVDTPEDITKIEEYLIN